MLLNGEYRDITFDPNRPISAVKAEIQEKLGPETSKQKLVYGEIELKVGTRLRFYNSRCSAELLPNLNDVRFPKPCAQN